MIVALRKDKSVAWCVYISHARRMNSAYPCSTMRVSVHRRNMTFRRCYFLSMERVRSKFYSWFVSFCWLSIYLFCRFACFFSGLCAYPEEKTTTVLLISLVRHATISSQWNPWLGQLSFHSLGAHLIFCRCIKDQLTAFSPFIVHIMTAFPFVILSGVTYPID